MATTNTYNIDIDKQIRGGYSSSNISPVSVRGCAVIEGEGGSGSSRPLFRFSSLPSNVSSVTNAKLQLRYSTKSGTITSKEIRAYQVTRDNWTESAQWATYDGTNNWTNTGGDFSTSVYCTYSCKSSYSTNELIEIDVTSLLNEILAVQELTQADILLKWTTEANGGLVLSFKSEEDGTADNRPKLSITYTQPVNETVVSVVADVSVAATAPSVIIPINETVVSVPANVSVEAPTPVPVIGYIIKPPTTNIAAVATAPTIKVSTKVISPSANTEAASTTPVIKVSTKVISPSALINAGANAPAIYTGISVQSPSASVGVSATIPTIKISTKVISQPANITAESTVPSIKVSTKVSSVPAAVAVAALTPNIIYAIKIESVPANVSVEALEPLLKVSTKVRSVPANVSVEALEPSIKLSTKIFSAVANIGVSATIPTVGISCEIVSPTADIQAVSNAPSLKMSLKAISPPAVISVAAIAPKAPLSMTVKTSPANINVRAIAPRIRLEELRSEPISILIYGRDDEAPLAIINEFESVEYSKQANEAGRISVSFASWHPANKLIRSLYSNMPKGAYALIYRRGSLFDGGILAETDITKNPITWHLLTNEAILRDCITPSNWSLEELDLHDTLASLAEYGFRWHQYNSYSDLDSAVKAHTALNTWHSLADTTEGYDQPLVLLEKDGQGKYYETGTITFAWDLGEIAPLERIRWKAEQGDKNTIAYRWRASSDNITWTEWTALTEVNDTEYAEKMGIQLTGSKRYVELELTLATSDRTSKDYEGEEAGTTPVLYGVELITRYRTSITAGTIGTNSEKIPSDFIFTHDNALSVIASLCEFFGYQFKVDANKTFTVTSLAAGEPHVLKAGDTCEPQGINYRGIESVINVLTAYGAGEGLGRLSVTLEETDSIETYGRRLGIYEDSKITTLAELQEIATEKIGELAYPSLDLQIKAKYDESLNVLNGRVNDYIMFISESQLMGVEESGYKLGYIKAEKRSFTSEGETVTLGLDTELDNIFVRDAKNRVKRQYKKGRAIAKTPINLIANGGQGHIKLEWQGYADSYIVEHSDTLSGSFVSIGTTITKGFVHAQLASGSTHYYRVKGLFEGVPSSPSGVASATVLMVSSDDFDTTPPAVPSGLAGASTVISAGGGVYLIINTLTWNANAEEDISQYHIFRSIDDTTYKAIGIIPAGTHEYKDISGLEPATTYYYKIAASDKLGNRSDLSAAEDVLTAGDSTPPTIEETAPLLSRGKKLIAVTWTGANDLDLSHYEVQRDFASAVFNEDTEEWEAPEIPSGSGWATISAALIKGKTYMDYDVDYEKCYTYRYRAIDTSGNASSWSLGSLWKTPSMIGEADIAVHSIVAEMYKDIRNNIAYTYEGDLDATHPLEKVFYIPTETTEIIACLLSAFALRFRANSTGAESGGSHSHTVTIAAHTHGISYAYVSDGVVTASAGGFTHGHAFTGTAGTTGSESSHTHSYSKSGDTGSDGSHTHSFSANTSVGGDHAHWVPSPASVTSWDAGSHGHSVSGDTGSAGSHTHAFSFSGTSGAGSSHSHSFTPSGSNATHEQAGHQHGHGYMVPDSISASGGSSTPTSEETGSHTHDIVYGIYESTTPANVKLYINNGLGYGSAIDLNAAPDTNTPYELSSELNITEHLSGTGWKKIKLTSSRLGNISLCLILKADLTA